MESIEPLVKEILVLEKQGATVEENRMAATKGLDKEIEGHQIEIVEIRGEIDRIAEPFLAPAEKLAGQIKDKKDIIETEMRKADKKTVELDFAKVQMTTTKSVKILNKVGLVKTLVDVNGGIENGIKSFSLRYIQGLMNVNVVTPDLAEFDISRRVKITAKEA